MTDKEKAIVMAYTGICMLTEDKFQIFHKYVEELMGRPILTHEMGWLADVIKEKSKVDFMALCADESSGQEPILDMIRAELIQSIQNGTIKIESGTDMLFRIIELYKAESEEQDR